MNIGMFTDTYYPQINGLVTSLKMLENEMSKNGHKLYIFTTTYPTAKEKLPNVFRLPSISFKLSPSHRVAILYPLRLLLGMKKFKLDMVHTHSEFPLGIFGKLVSGFYRKPIVHTYHTLWEEYVHYFGNSKIITKKNARRYSRFFCNGVDAIIAPTEKTKNILTSYGIKKDITIIPTGINFEPFRPSNFSKTEIEELKTSLGIPLDSPIILNVGRIAREKSIDHIIDCMPDIIKTMPNVKLVIVGDGPALEQLKEQTDSSGVRDSIYFTGSRPWDEIGKYYQLGDVFVSASTSETQGLTYVEAIAAGVTVVVHSDECSKGIIDDGTTGFFFEGKNEMPLVITKALSLNETEKDKMHELAFERIADLSAEKFAENVEEFYRSVITQYKTKKHKRVYPKIKAAKQHDNNSPNNSESTYHPE